VSDLARASACPVRMQAVKTDAPFDMWLADTGACPADHALAWLSPVERQRAARFRFARDRDRYLAAHVALRWLIARQTGRAPARQRFTTDAFGKPWLDEPAGCRFNISYADGVALIGLSDRAEIGVDIEADRPLDDMIELADLHFTAEERRHLGAKADPAARRFAFFCGWSRKEACLKALGTGLSLPPASLRTGLEAASRLLSSSRVRLETASFVPRTGYFASWARIIG
jgi:4'-phosphopantetheinyl transferase